MKKVLIYAYLLLFGIGGIMSQDSIADNVAKKCSYTLSPQPNYSLCTGASDLTDLTDGKHAAASIIWFSQATVGWNNIAVPIKITVDLGRIIPINRVTFSTAGNCHGVKYPNFIDVEVSVDGREYYTLGNLTALSKNRPPNIDAGYKNLVFDAEFSTVNTRFVRLRCIPDGQYVFCDEVEVFSGDGEKAKAVTELSPVLSDAEFTASVIPRLVESYCKRRFEIDLNVVCRNLEKTRIDENTKQELMKQAKELSGKINKWQFTGNVKTFRAVAPFNDLHTDIYKLNGKIMKLQGFDALSLRTCDRYDRIEPLQFPEGVAPQMLSTAMMNNEHRAVVLNLTNASAEPLTVGIKTVNIPAAVYNVEYVDSSFLELTPTALVKITDETTVPAGMTRQLWFSFAPDDLSPGINNGQIELTCNGTTHAVPVRLDIAKVKFPEQVSMSTGLWDYLDFDGRKWSRGVNLDKVQAAVADERDHLINVTVAENGIGNVSRHPENIAIDESGNIVTPLDFTKFDTWTKQWPDARHYMVFVNINDKTKFGSSTRGTPIFNQAVKNWAEQWDKHLKQLGMNEGRVIFEFLDEPQTDSDYLTVKQWFEAFKSGSKLIHIFCNPLVFKDKYRQDVEQADILSPILDLALDNKNGEVEFFKEWTGKSKTLWFYKCHCGPFNASPSHYRLQPWFCFKFKASGLGLWSYCDTAGIQDNSWNQYLARSIYLSPVLFDKNGIIPTKHWEALREGIEDYEYLSMLRQAINITGKSRNSEIISEAEALLCTTVQQVAQAPNFRAAWRDKNTCKLAEEKRLEILNMLNRLAEKK